MPNEIDELIRVATALRPAGSMRPLTYVTLLGLLAATGMRISEALALQLDDVTVDGLLIRQTKCQKSRLCRCMQGRSGRSTGIWRLARSLGVGTSRSSCPVPAGSSLNTVKGGVFLQLLTSAGMEGVSSPRKPRMNDLRHTPSPSAR